MSAAKPRTADPYGDLAVIDARAPRFNQAVVGLLSAAGALTGAWWPFLLVSAQLALGLWLGRRFCLPCRFYFDVIQPRVGEGPLEDSRPPRFANQLGAVVTGAAALAGAAGLGGVAAALGGLVAALALLSAATGFCAGCWLYATTARLRGLRTRQLDRIDLEELQVPPGREVVVQFTHPLCSDCHALTGRLRAAGEAPVLVDVSRRPDLARRYGVAVVPFAVRVAPDGRVCAQVA
ncbi:MAG: DUF4395 family protein [Anaeromyxobacter sp.]